MKSKWLISVGLVVCLLMAFALPMCAPTPPVEEEAPPVEEELAKYIKAYMAITPENNIELCNFIKEELGVEVRQTYTSCGECEAKLIAEAPRFSADMVIHMCGPQAFVAKDEGWSIAYDSPIWREASEIWKDPDNYWWSHGNLSFYLVGSKEKLDAAGYTMPESWDDLLDPKWKGEIVTSSPLTSGAAYRILFSFITLYGLNTGKGEEGGWEYIEALDKNIDHYTKSGNAPSDLCGRGEFMLGIAYSVGALDRISEGYPLYCTVPKEGTGIGPAPSFILKGTEKEYTCQKIIDLLGSHEGCQFMANLGGYDTKDPTAVGPTFAEVFPEGINYIPNIDLAWAYGDKDRLVNEWKDRIGRPVK